MPVPSRVFVGVTLFGLIASLLVVPYTVLVVRDYHPPPDAPYEALFPADSNYGWGDKSFLVLASVFSVALTVAGWRALLHGARRDMARRRAIEKGGKDLSAPPSSPETKRPPPPPGYQ
ncbi:MAG TPA: hypothetical protein VI796_07530 [Candidatus Thermoplasmatota archaeon]|nr:hypothetical protein [Candidatus Thermoplasmatota archaeon]